MKGILPDSELEEYGYTPYDPDEEYAAALVAAGQNPDAVAAQIAQQAETALGTAPIQRPKSIPQVSIPPSVQAPSQRPASAPPGPSR